MKEVDPLNRLLESWNPDAQVPAGFRDQVWQRIALATKPTVLRLPEFSWRAAAMSTAAVAVFGFFLGNFIEAKAGDSDRAAYFQRINPLAQSR